MKYLKTYKIFESDSNKEMLDNIEDIFREIEDLGFKVEYNRGGVGEVTRIYIEKFDTYGFSDEPRPLPYIPGQEFVLALQHLISYVSQDYDIEIESICDSQCIDHLSSKSEDGLIENDATIIGNYKVPIDYIKVIISNKEDNISESKIEYDADWKRPGNPVREELEVELREIFLEITDLGYRPQLSGFTKGFSESGPHFSYPYVWICNQRRKSNDDFWNEINDTVERIKDYLIDKGFKVNQEILNEGSSHEQVYIYFDMIN